MGARGGGEREGGGGMADSQEGLSQNHNNTHTDALRGKDQFEGKRETDLSPLLSRKSEKDQESKLCSCRAWKGMGAQSGRIV